MQGPHAAVDQTDVCQKQSRGGHGSGHFVGKAYAAPPPAFETGRTCCRVMLCPLPSPWQVYHAEVGEDVDDEELLASFRSFASFGAGAASSLHAVGGRAVEMDGPRFAKLCRETGLQAGHLSSVGIDIIFSQVKAKVRPPPLPPPPPVVTTLSSAVAVVRGERLLFLVSTVQGGYQSADAGMQQRRLCGQRRPAAVRGWGCRAPGGSGFGSSWPRCPSSPRTAASASRRYPVPLLHGPPCTATAPPCQPPMHHR